MKIQISILLAGCMLFSKAQTVGLIKGEEFEHSKKLRYTLPVEGDESARYFLESAYSWPEGQCMLYRVGLNNGKVLFGKEIVYEKRNEFIAAYNKNGRVLIFTKLKDYKKDILFLLLREFDSKTGEELGETKIVSELSLKDEKNFERDFIVSFSPDNSKVLVVSEERGKKTAPEISAKLYETEGFKNLWEKKAITVFENSPVYTFNYLTGNDGSFTYLFAFFRSNSETDIGYGIGLIPSNNFQNRMIKLPAQNKTLYMPVLEYVENNLVCSGEFFEGGDRTKKNKDLKGMGFFFMTINVSSSEIETQSFDALSEELKTKLSYPDKSTYYAVSGVTATNYANKNYRHFRVLLLKGSFYLVRHHSYILYINGVPTTTNKEIIVLKYNQEKQLEWMRMIPRNTYVMGIVSDQLNLVCSEKLNFLYYEHPKNQKAWQEEYDPKGQKMLTSPDEKSLVLTSINEAGEIKRQLVPTESTFYITEEFKRKCSGDEPRDLGIGDTGSKKTRRYDIITLKD